jgi:hypothetical protein
VVRTRREVQREIAAAERQLAVLGADRITERLGWEGILAAAQEELKSAPPRAEPSVSALYFEGKPVAGSHGIEIRFAGEVLKDFGQALYHQLKRYTVESANVHLTHRLAGSYGFAIEEAESPELPGLETESAVGLAMRDILTFIEAAGADTDAQFVKVAPEILKNAFSSLRNFLAAVDASGAVFRLQVKDRVVALDRRRVRKAVERASAAGVDEYEVAEGGIFEGFLPYGRRFEFRVVPKRRGANVIRGDVSPAADRDAISAFFKKRCVALLLVSEVAQGTPKARKRYTLLDLITESEHARRVAARRD